METPCTLELDSGVATLVLEGPPRNELSLALFGALGRLVRHELPLLDVRGLIVRGRGRHFSSGSRIPELLHAAAQPTARRWNQEHQRTLQALGELPYPSVAAISGCCMGSALELALACNFRVTARGAMLALPEAEYGLMPGCGGTVMGTARVGYAACMRLAISAQPVGADEARELGLVDVVVPRQELLRASRTLITSAFACAGNTQVSPCASC